MVRLVDGLGVACCAPIGMQHATNAGIAQQATQQQRNSVAPLHSVAGIQSAQQPRNSSATVDATNRAVFEAALLHDSKPVARATAAQQRAVVEYRLIAGKGGLLIDPAGAASAVRELDWRYGARVDWPALLAMFEAREQDADREAADLIRRMIRDANA